MKSPSYSDQVHQQPYLAPSVSQRDLHLVMIRRLGLAGGARLVDDEANNSPELSTGEGDEERYEGDDYVSPETGYREG